MITKKQILFTRLWRGNLEVVSRTIYEQPKDEYGRTPYYYFRKDDIIISSHKVSPQEAKPMWDGQPFLHYDMPKSASWRDFAGNLSYKQFCDIVETQTKWVFTDWTTNHSDGFFEGACRFVR